MKRFIYIAIIALLVGTNAFYAQNKPSKQNLRKAFEQLDYKNLSEAVHYLSLHLKEAPDDANAHLLKSPLHGYLLKKKLSTGGIQLVSSTHDFKFEAPDGKMRKSPVDDSDIRTLLRGALTDKINDRELFMKGIDYSYYYEQEE